MPPRQPFTQGPRLTDAPSGDPAAQAIASLRGYAYQLYASGLAWLDLELGEELYLEVAEDYAVAARAALHAVQVRDTPASNITINSRDVRDALDSFVDLVERNPTRPVHFRYLSTSSVGLEQSQDHRANGKASLHYWRLAAAGADIFPLRQVLSRLDLSDRVRAFIQARNDDALRAEFLRRVHWDSGQHPIDGVLHELENSLLRYYVEHFRAPARRELLAAAVVHRVLATITQSADRRLTEGDLLSLVVDTANVLVPASFLEAAGRSIGGGVAGEQDSGAIELSRVLEPEADIPLPPILAQRVDVTDDALVRLQHDGIGFITGSTGCGKTTIARLTARAQGAPWGVLDLREASAELVSQRLDVALSVLRAGGGGIILDDLNELEDPGVRRALSRFLAALRRKDVLCLVTAYRKPSSRAFSELGIDETTHLAVPDLTGTEVAKMVAAAGGEPEMWTDAVRMAGAFGHPQLVQAVISGLRTRGWPPQELGRLCSFDQSSDIEAERLAARHRLVAILPNETSAMLYRVSLLVGRFDRPLALAVGAVNPPVPEPGAQLDHLIGPWIEIGAYREMRVSPLLQNAGNEVFTPGDTTKLHEAAAVQILGGRVLRIDKANSGFLHGLLGRSESSLLRLARAIIATEGARRPQLSEWITGLRLHRLDQKIFAERPALSILLRLAQFLLVTPTGKPEAIRDCWRVLYAELNELDHAEAREHLEYMILAKALLDQEAVAFLPDGVALILRFEELSRADSMRLALMEQRLPVGDAGRSPSLLGTLFISCATRMESVGDLKCAFDRLDATTPELRRALLSDVFDAPGDFALVVNHAWLEESRGENPDWPAHEAAYMAMAVQAQQWGYPELALRCHAVRSIILEEYLNDPAAALRALDDGQKLLGESPVLDRARAKVLFRRNDHEGALRLFRDAAEQIEPNDPVSRAYMLREAGISAAETGQWAEAQRWLAAAREAASSASSATMRIMAIGLRADEAMAAYKADDGKAALTGFDATLNDLSPIDPTSSVAAGYRHRVVRHSILWLYGEATRQDVNVDGEPAVMIPGMCSNPEPTDLSDMPLGSIDYVRYLLAQAEVALGEDAGIQSGLRAHLGGRAIPDMEISLRGTRMEFAMRRLDVSALVKNLPSWVDATLYLAENRERVHESGPGNPAYGEIDAASPQQLESAIAIASGEDALLAFGIISALRQRSAALEFLGNVATGIPDKYSGRAVAKVMASGTPDDYRLESMIAAQIYQVALRPDLSPNELCIAGVRFVQSAKSSNFKKLLVPAIEQWARERWAYVIEQQTFNLRNPIITVPSIGEALVSPATGLTYLGRLFVAIEPAVKVRFPQDFREFLLAL